MVMAFFLLHLGNDYVNRDTGSLDRKERNLVKHVFARLCRCLEQEPCQEGYNAWKMSIRVSISRKQRAQKQLAFWNKRKQKLKECWDFLLSAPLFLSIGCLNLLSLKNNLPHCLT